MFRHPIRTIARHGAMGTLALLLAGCAEDSNRLVGPPRYGDPAGIVSTLRVSPVAFQPGEKVSIEVSMMNPTRQPIALGFSSGCTFHYSVTNSGGEYVAPYFICTQDAPTVVIGPGKILTKRFEWDGTNQASPALLPAGEYRVGTAGVRNPPAPVRVEFLAP